MSSSEEATRAGTPAPGLPSDPSTTMADSAIPPPCRLSALELAAAIRSGEVSSRHVVEAHLERIDAVNGSVNAVVRRLDDEALAAAEEADAAVRAGETTGPLHGVPLTLKENIDLAGHPTTLGTIALAHAAATADEPIVERLKAAGAIPLARTNLPDMAMRLHTDSGLHGPTWNPWDPAVTPGGSSGGEAVSVATGMSPLGIGGDMCGSLRWPSQCCGIATLKPTLGAVPRAASPMAPYGVELMAVLGPLARTVADLQVAFEAMAGAHPVDPWSYPATSSVDALSELPARRVAVSTDPGGGGTHPSVVAGIEQAAGILEQAGWEIVEADPPQLGEAARLWPEINYGNPTSIDAMTSLLSPDAQLALRRWARAAGVRPDGNTFVEALQRRGPMVARWAGFFQTHGLWLTATATEQPFEVGADLASVERVQRILEGHRVIMATNSLGLPSVVIPIGVSDGLPQSVQIIGPRFAEFACLRAAEVIERRVGILTPIEPRPNGSVRHRC